MNKRAILLAVILFVLIVAGMFLFAHMKQQERLAKEEADLAAAKAEAKVEPIEATRIDAKHYYIDGVHTIVGEIAMPTPCDLLTGSAKISADGKRETITFDVTNNSDSCAQMVTAQRFKVSWKGPADMEIEAVFKGQPAILNLIPARDGEDPSDFELFIKG